MEHPTNGLTAVAKQVSARMTANLTPEQKAAAQEARRRAGLADDSEMFRVVLADFCARYGVDFPQVELPSEGRNWKRGKGGKFTEKP
jgi:hypothetical protein